MTSQREQIAAALDHLLPADIWTDELLDRLDAIASAGRPVPCHRTMNHLAHRVPMMIRCEGVGPQECTPGSHVGPWVSTPRDDATGVRQIICSACGTKVPALKAAKPLRCTQTAGVHEAHVWDGPVSGAFYRCDGQNPPILNRGAN